MELFKSFSSAKLVQDLLIPWYAPTLVAAFFFWLVDIPRLRTTSPGRTIEDRLSIVGVDGIWLFLIFVLAIAIILWSVARTLFQVLEGIRAWPNVFRKRRQRAHLLQHAVLLAERQVAVTKYELEWARVDLEDSVLAQQELRAGRSAMDAEVALRTEALEAAQNAATNAEVALTQAREARSSRRLWRTARPPKRPRWLARVRTERPMSTLDSLASYPLRPEAVMPTKLGNRLRSLESYGFETFGLDSQTLWYELVALAPEDLRAALSGASQSMDQSLCSTYVAGLLGLASLLTLLVDSSWPPLLLGVLAMAASLLFYRQLQNTVEEYRYPVQAIVHLGKKPLAESLELQVPDGLVEQRAMWNAVTGFVQSRGAEWERTFRQYHSTGPK